MWMMLVLVAGFLTYVYWDQFCLGFDYFPNPFKTWLVTKDSCHSNAEIKFAGSNVTRDGLTWALLLGQASTSHSLL